MNQAAMFLLSIFIALAAIALGGVFALSSNVESLDKRVRAAEIACGVEGARP